MCGGQFSHDNLMFWNEKLKKSKGDDKNDSTDGRRNKTNRQ